MGRSLMKSGDTHRRKMAAVSREKASREREIGPTPDIASVQRRSRCRKSLRLFCETYNPESFWMPWSADHLRAIGRIEEAVIHGALYAFAEPRGNGKTSRVRMAALWALAYAYRRYVFVIGANTEKAEATLTALKIYCRFLPLFAADFPEISHAAQALGGIANRATGQTSEGQSTLIEWAKDRIVLPTVAPPRNWPKKWALRADGMVPTSGAAVSASGLTGEGIRGSLLTLNTGESIRPDLVLLDDPQTPESARSPTQNATRTSLVSADVLGMAGPGRSIAAVMPCTVIEPGDMVDTLLNRERNPLWRGERTRMLATMPTNLAAWDKYFETYAACALKEPPDYATANAAYESNRAELDEGASASWAERKLPTEVSAVQHAMHLYYRDKRTFLAEYQNDPRPADEGNEARPIDSDFVREKVNQCDRGKVPVNCSRLTAFLDPNQEIVIWAVVGWDERFGPSVVDYGAFPKQMLNRFDAKNPLPSLSGKWPENALEARVYAGLAGAATDVLGRNYPRADGTGEPLRVELCLVDSGWGPMAEHIHQWCRETPYRDRVKASRGRFVGATKAPLTTWKPGPGDRKGDGWILKAGGAKYGKEVLFDANQWKSFVAERCRMPMGTTGGLTLFGGNSAVHGLFCEHLAAEFPKRATSDGRTVDEWQVRPGRPDNDYFDCLVGCSVAASVLGLRFDASANALAAAKAKAKPVSLRALQERNRKAKAQRQYAEAR